jgi:hypothetical protein
MESVEIAGRIINAALVGPGDEERPKDEALEQTATA